MFKFTIGLARKKEPKAAKGGKAKKGVSLKKKLTMVKLYKAKFLCDIQDNIVPSKWQEEVRAIHAKADALEKELATPNSAKFEEYKKEFANLANALSKLNEEIVAITKKMNEFEQTLKKFIEKLRGLKNQESKEFVEINTIVKDIQDRIATAKKTLDDALKILGECHTRLSVIERPINKWLFCNLLEDSDHRCQKLSERFDFLCRLSAETTPGSHTAVPFDQKQIKSILHQLQGEHERSGKLLAQITANIHHNFPDAERKEAVPSTNISATR